MNVSTVWGNIWPYLVAVAVFLILIVIHEFGHFIAAKLLGVRVNEFAVGFGPKLFKKKLGETIYAVNLIPLGGYCAMEGEDESSTDSKAFCNKRPWRRFLIVVMGAVFNLIFGLIIIACTLIPQDRFTTTTIAEFREESVSNNHGLKVNDKIVEVDGRKIYSTYDLSYAFTNIDDGAIDIKVVREGEKVLLEDVKFKTEEIDGISYLTVDFYVYGREKNVGSFITETVNTAISYGAVIWRSLIDLISGKYGISAVSGPVGVTAVIGNAAKQSLENLLPIMALITINLGIFNLLPLPAL
ncbi:MAG: site-2 protease family protein, partial [Clostridia bacterium]|nr:site-2 protease family protein [Clostridia bacterium]